MILVLCDLRADELSRICPVILSPSPLAGSTFTLLQVNKAVNYCTASSE